VPNLPDIPGKSLIGGTTKRARVVAAAGAGAALAVGGVVAKRVLGHGGKDDGAKDDGVNGAADLIAAEADARVVPITKAKAPPKPKPAKPKASKAKPKPVAKPAAAPKPKAAAKPKAAPKPKPAKAKPAKAKTGPGDISVDREHPHRALNNPVGEPDETEYPDPYETRPDPRGPSDPDGAPFGEEPHPVVGSESTSEPPREDDPEQPEGGRPPRRENLDQ
jgi:hypothetical protein